VPRTAQSSPTVDVAVYHRREGRLRVVSRYFFADPRAEICRDFVQKLFEVEEVRAVEVRPSTASAHVEYAVGRAPSPDVLAKIGRHFQNGHGLSAPSARSLDGLPLGLADGADGWRVERHGPLLSTWEIRHELPGRIRVRNRLLHRKRDVFRVVERKLDQAAGVHGHRTNPSTATALVVYDPERIDRQRLIRVLDEAVVDAAHGNGAPHAPDLDRPERNWKERPPTRVDGLLLGVSLVASAVGDALLMPGLSLLSVPGTVYVSRGLYRNGLRSLFRKGEATVETLLIVAHAMSVMAGYFFLFTLITAISEGTRKLVERIKRDSRSHYTDVFGEQARTVWVRIDGVDIEMPLHAVKAGDLVSLTAGQTVPVDGQVAEGLASVDQHLLTGEAAPEEKGVGDPVFAMTVVLSGNLRVRVERTGAATAAAQIAQVLDRTVDYKTTRKLRAEHVADRLVLPAFGLGLLAWPLLGASAGAAFVDAHPKNKMTLSYSIGMLNYFRLAARQGLLIKDARAIELLNEVDTVVFDKTGTLTFAEPHVGALYTRPPYTANGVLSLAAAAEQHQSHPIARAIMRLARARRLPLPPVDHASYRVGYGLSVTIDGRPVRVGSLRLMEQEGIAVPAAVVETQRRCHDEGHSLVLIAVDGDVAGAIELRATLRPEARGVVDGLRQRGRTRIYVVSGDHEAPTRRLAEALGVERYFAETLPEDKAALIQGLRDTGRVVCYVGDGINDSIAMKTSHVSVSLRGASTLATDTADVVLLDGSLNQLCRLFDLARECERSVSTTLASVLLPSVLCVGGILLLGFGFLHARILTIAGVVLGVGTAMVPAFTHRDALHGGGSPALPAPPADVVEHTLG
jgi:Cu2+-exporting ATPase